MDDAEELNVLREASGAHIPLISWGVKSALRRGAARKRCSRPWASSNSSLRRLFMACSRVDKNAGGHGSRTDRGGRRVKHVVSELSKLIERECGGGIQYGYIIGSARRCGAMRRRGRQRACVCHLPPEKPT